MANFVDTIGLGGSATDAVVVGSGTCEGLVIAPVLSFAEGVRPDTDPIAPSCEGRVIGPARTGALGAEAGVVIEGVVEMVGGCFGITAFGAETVETNVGTRSVGSSAYGSIGRIDPDGPA
ncbi:MAG: hypothetical protein AB7T06_31415 [Kofleriaceae bacterium]